MRFQIDAARVAGGLLVAWLAAVGLPPAAAVAHAELTRSEPSADAVLEMAPGRVALWFSEEPELRFSEIQVVDRSGRSVERGGLRADPADKLMLSVGLGDLAPGTYTVTWKALSAVDGHATRGVFVFAVGADQTLGTAFVAGSNESSTATPDQIAVRFLTYVGLALLLAVFPFLLWVLLPGLAAGRASLETTAQAWQRCWTLALVGAALAGLGALGGLAAEAATAFGVPFPQALGPRMLDVALGTRFGALWGTTAVLLLVLGGLVIAGRQLPPWRPLLRLGVLAGGAVAFARALGTHAAAVPDTTPAAVALDWLHLGAMAAWVGGLAYLALVLGTLRQSRQRGEALRVAAALVPRFSALAAVCVGTLLFTGLYQAWLQVGSLDALLGTAYGRALLLKLALTLPLLGLGAANLLVMSPRLRAAGRGPDRTGLVTRLRQSVLAEALCGAAVLLVVGVMTNLQPAREALAARGIVRSVRAEDLRAAVQVQPGLAAVNRFDVLLTDPAGGPLEDAEKVALRFTMRSMDMGESELVAAPRGGGHYLAQGGNLAMAGPWEVDVLVRRAGRDDVRATITLDVDTPPPPNTALAAPRTGEANLVLGVELLVLALAILGLTGWAMARRSPLVRWAAPLAVAVVLVGGGLTVRAAVALSINAVRNPIPPLAASVARGEAIYREYCTTCHGESGRGDGPAGLALVPRPADFAVHLAAGHSDGQLFAWISNGFPGSAMPAWKDQLSEEDRWHVLNYLQQTFGPAAASNTPWSGSR